ncbi:hypothetical protein [Candidatus Methylobacter oryzae]|uniref:Uncharacterized protein n=1 Tax=Candidatus Methylobacter oryzae TaxID=2497749 RepID=A0ABY3C579_9GAMM|nr:hypothetical protein [Candidatus Methylobacter oryzae]TRW89999.1 hypothetical protein EKO24_020480 [Candidatus Methylobacter oryzae]
MIETKLREYENLHIVLWLLKDTCWLMEWRLEGVFMIMPTVAAAFHITWLGRKNTADLFHNLAVSSWICGNALWMIGEFFFDDTFRPFARIFFGIGFVFLGIYYFGVLPREKRLRRSEL